MSMDEPSLLVPEMREDIPDESDCSMEFIETEELPLPAMHSLDSLLKALDVDGVLLSTQQRAARVRSIVEHDGQFMKELLRVADQCKDMEDDESLELLFQIVKRLRTCIIYHKGDTVFSHTFTVWFYAHSYM
jgi:hypothetical protein